MSGMHERKYLTEYNPAFEQHAGNSDAFTGKDGICGVRINIDGIQGAPKVVSRIYLGIALPQTMVDNLNKFH